MRNLVLCGGIWRRSWAQERPNVGNMAGFQHAALKSRSCSTRGNLGPFGASFARNAAQQRHDMGNIAHNDASSMQKTWGTPMKIGCFEDFGLGWPCPLLFKPCGPSCGPEPVHLDDAGPIYKCANFQSRALFGGVDPEIAPPAEAVPGWQIGPFVSSAPKLSRRCGRISFSTCLKLGWWHRMCVKSLGTPATGMVSNFLRTLGGLIEPWLNSVLQMGFD